MISPADFARQWNKPLARPDAAAVQSLKAPEETKRFLLEAGLPVKAGLGYGFEFPGGQIPRLADALGPGAEVTADLESYRRLGGAAGTHVCLNEARQAQIDAVGADPEVPTAFMNSSVPQLAETFLAFRRLYAEYEESDEGVASGARQQAFADKMRAEFQRIDPAAVKTPETVWSDVLMQMEQGLI